jgi:hypothetical protein
VFVAARDLLLVFLSDTEQRTNVVGTFEVRSNQREAEDRSALDPYQEKILFRIGFVIPAICELVNAPV